MSEFATNHATDRLVDFLRQPSSYAERPKHVEVVETHISWVFLTDQHAYKLKKPVRFDFLDFSSRDLRRQACENELRLNRRLAPDVYLSAIPITEDGNGRLQLAGDGKVVDWVVQMRRLPAERELSRLIQENRLADSAVQRIAALLADFYALLPLKSIRGYAYRQALEDHIRGNLEVLLPALTIDSQRIRLLHSAQLRYLCVRHSLFDNRAASGRIADGHGDLRPEHIYLVDPPVVIDCIEFSEELRTVDVADELNFLAMECDRLGNVGVGESILSTYEARSADQIRASLSWFYRSYRACVRAKVAVIQGQQHSMSERALLEGPTGEYLNLAEHYTSLLGPPCLLVVFGLMGSGKSTLANAVAKAFGIEVLSTDHIRRSKFGVSRSATNYGKEFYRPESRKQVYDELLSQAGNLLASGQSVILDGTFLSKRLRNEPTELGDRHGAETLLVLCQCPRKTALARIASRQKAGNTESEGRVDLYDRQRADFQQPTGDEPVIYVDTTSELTEQMLAVFDALDSRLFS